MHHARRLIRRSILIATMCGLASAPSASAVALPPQLVAKLEGERARANQELELVRAQLAKAALAQRAASAKQQQLVRQRAILEQVAGLVDMQLPPPVAEPIEQAVAARGAASRTAQSALETRTQEAAEAQAFALDADRRLRALQRASATEDQRDTTLGSWRFGSGGPAVSADSIDQYLASK